MTSSRPPLVAQWLLERLLPRGVRGDSIRGDLVEEFRARPGASWRVACWYWAQALSLSIRYRGGNRYSGAHRTVARWSMSFQGMLGDVRYAIRALRKSPAFVAVAVLSIALGVGANTAIFTLVDQLLLRQLPVSRPEELVLLTSRGVEYGGGWGDGNELSYPMYEDLRDHNDVFSGMFCRFSFDLSVSLGDRTDRVSSELVSGSYFPVLGVGAARGRVIDPSDDTAPDAQPVVVLSHEYWSARFARDPTVLGKTLLVDNHPMTVIGVAQAGFHGTNLGKAAQVFIPIRQAPVVTPLTAGLTTGASFDG